jgi:HSP20 family protein
MSLLDFHRELDRQLFGNELWNRSSQAAPNLKMELRERPTEYELAVEAAGLPKDQMKISYENGVLTVSAKHKETKLSKDERVHFSERTYGYCSRQIRLPKNIDASNIVAKYNDGVLKITVPKHEKQESSNLIRIE